MKLTSQSINIICVTKFNDRSSNKKGILTTTQTPLLYLFHGNSVFTFDLNDLFTRKFLFVIEFQGKVSLFLGFWS